MIYINILDYLLSNINFHKLFNYEYAVVMLAIMIK